MATFAMYTYSFRDVENIGLYLGRIIVCCVGGNNRSRTVIELFYYLTTGQHLIDEYKGYQNHLLYNIGCGFLDEHILDASIIPEKIEKLDKNNDIPIWLVSII